MGRKKFSGQLDAAQWLSEHLRSRGVDVSPLRLEERAAAQKAAAKREMDADIEQTKTLASAVKKAARAVEIEEAAWRSSPNARTLEAAQEAQRTRAQLLAELNEACLQDADLVSALTRD
jgi:hypothetical protein